MITMNLLILALAANEMTQDLTVHMDEGKLNIHVAIWIDYKNNILVSKFPGGNLHRLGNFPSLNLPAIHLNSKMLHSHI